MNKYFTGEEIMRRKDREITDPAKIRAIIPPDSRVL